MSALEVEVVLDRLCSAEDEFDADLMACGCRVPGPPTPALRSSRDLLPELSAHDLLRLYKFDDYSLGTLIALLISEGKLSNARVLQLAEQVASGAR